MQTVTVSTKFQIVIPREIRQSLNIVPGEVLQVFNYDGRLEFVRQQEIKKMRGFLKGIDTTIERDGDRI